MDHVNTICDQEGYPIVVENSPTLGNHAKAARAIPQGEGLLRAVPYAAEVFDNYKKRMCHVCLLYHNRGSFTHRCQDCDQVYYCSPECKSVAMDPNAGAHGKICKTLRKLATWNSDRHTKSIFKLLIQVLMNHWRERQGIPTAYQSRRSFQEIKEKIVDTDIRTDSQSDDKDSAVHVLEGATTAAAVLTNDMQTKLRIADKDPMGIEEDVSEQRSQSRVQQPVENDFYDFLRLQSHFEDWDAEDTKGWNKQLQIVLSLLEMAGLTEMATEPGKDAELKTVTSLDIKKMISALESNAFGMFDRSKKNPVCFGRAIYPIASFFNHSCDCNATAVQADGTMEEITGDDVLGYVDGKQEAAVAVALDRKEQNSTTSTPKTTSAPVSTSESASSPAEQMIDTDREHAKDSDPSETAEQVQDLEVGSEVDPYYARVGEFRMMTFFAVKDIPKGQDITISYIDTELPLQARRLALLTDYHFHCCCERCLLEEKMHKSTTPKGFIRHKGGGTKPKNRKTSGGQAGSGGGTKAKTETRVKKN